MFATPRWIASHLFALTLVVAFVIAGLWQLERLEDRQDRNDAVLSRMGEVTGLDEVVALEAVGTEPSELEFRRIQIEGRYEPDRQVLIANRSREGISGFWMWTVFSVDSGFGEDREILVNRGFVDRGIVLGTQGSPPIEFTQPTAGELIIEGFLRVGDLEARISEDGSQITRPDAQLAVDLLGVETALAPTLYLQVDAQEPVRFESSPIPLPLPDLGEGPHRSYAFQWFTFATIGVIGYLTLLVRIRRGDQQRGDVPFDEALDAPVR